MRGKRSDRWGRRFPLTMTGHEFKVRSDGRAVVFLTCLALVAQEFNR